MANATRVINRHYANIGSVKILFNDDSKQTRTISSIDAGEESSPSTGTYFDKDSSRSPVSIEIQSLDGKWSISELPVEITYPNTDTGGISVIQTDAYIFYEWIIFLDE